MKDLGHGFTVVDKSIYQYDSEKFTSLKKLIDHDSFEMVTAFEDKTYYFRDKQRVYVTSYMCRASVIEGADRDAFEIIDAAEGIGFDGKKYYWYDSILSYDYSRAEKYNEYYLRAGGKVFFITDVVDGADADTFSIIWQNLARDKDALFFRDKKVPEADVDTFKTVPGCFDAFHLDQGHTYYAADKDNVYFVNTIGQSLKKLSRVKPADFSVKVVDDRLYGVTGKDVFYFGIKKKGLRLD
ncbi:DKNYY domain-containing protein [uncultured Flavobacterium sp.]|uniref:DKNYY domain-containing protein n=1 Tax=uncultured Flavobacterium sp. TaxID=165435 RepID=UPI0025CE84E8|nr:DKNYY domain-containing protein [uncultured Flavobacterium sp.]